MGVARQRFSSQRKHLNRFPRRLVWEDTEAEPWGGSLRRRQQTELQGHYNNSGSRSAPSEVGLSPQKQRSLSGPVCPTNTVEGGGSSVLAVYRTH